MSTKKAKPKKFKPSQSKLPGFTDKESEELEGVLEHYKKIEEIAKAKIKKASDEGEKQISDAAAQVIRVMTKHNRKSITIGGLMGQLLSVIKVKVKRQKGAKKEKKADAPKKAKRTEPKQEPKVEAPAEAPPTAAAAS